MNQPLAQATRTPRLRGTTLVLLQSCPFLVGGRIPGPGGMCQLTPVTLPHLTPYSGYPAPQIICPKKQHAGQTTPQGPTCSGGSPPKGWMWQGDVATNWASGLRCAGTWDHPLSQSGTEQGVGSRGNRSAGQILYWSACAGPQNVGMTSWLGNLEGDGSAKVGGRKIPNLEWVSFYHQGVNSPLLPISDCLREDLIMKGQWKCSRVWFFLSI